MNKDLFEEIGESISLLQNRIEELRYQEALDSNVYQKKVISAVRASEEIYKRTKRLAKDIRNISCEGANEIANFVFASVERYSERAYAFNLPEMISVRKKDASSGLGNIVKETVIELVEGLKKSGYEVNMLKNPVVHFLYMYDPVYVQKGFVPDADNLDSSKALDGLQTALLIKNDDVLSVTTIHEGRKVEGLCENKTRIFVYEKGSEKDFENSPKTWSVF